MAEPKETTQAAFMSRAMSLAQRGALTELERTVNEQYKALGETPAEESKAAPKFMVTLVGGKCESCGGRGRHVYVNAFNDDAHIELCDSCQGTGKQRTEVPLLDALRALGVMK